jgi:hypothetical protein
LESPPDARADVGEHEISTVSESDDEIVRECLCGWTTVGSIPEPDYHTPLVQREAEHLAKVAAIADGSVWALVPDRAEFEMALRRRFRTQEPAHVAVWAIWRGGSQEVLVWPWTEAGLAQAQQFCDSHRVHHARSGFLVQPGELAKYAAA